MSMSPDGQTVCSGAADENLKFWKVFAMEDKFLKTRGGSGKSTNAGKGGEGSGGGELGKKSKSSPDFGGCFNMR